MWHLETRFNGGFGSAGLDLMILEVSSNLKNSAVLWSYETASQQYPEETTHRNWNAESKPAAQSTLTWHKVLCRYSWVLNPGWLRQRQAVLTREACGAGAGWEPRCCSCLQAWNRPCSSGPAAPNPTMAPQHCFPSPGSHVHGGICCCRPSLDVPMLF